MDEIRVEEQRRFYEIARQRARELDVYMESFRRDIVESSKFDSVILDSQLDLQQKANSSLDGLTKLFREIREKTKIEDLSLQYQKFAEWLRIEYV